MEDNRPHVLLVDDDELILRIVGQFLRKACIVTTVKSAREALALLDAGNIDVIVTDLHMPEVDGLSFLEEAKERFPKVRRILSTGSMPLDIHRYIEAGTVEGCISKPSDAKRFIAEIKALYPKWSGG